MKFNCNFSGRIVVQVLTITALGVFAIALIAYNAVTLRSSLQNPVLQESIEKVDNVASPGFVICGRYASLYATTAVQGHIIQDASTGADTWAEGNGAGTSLNSQLVASSVWFPSLGRVLPSTQCVALPPGTVTYDRADPNVLSFFTFQYGSTGQVLFGVYGDADSQASSSKAGSITAAKVTVLANDVLGYIFFSSTHITHIDSTTEMQVDWTTTWAHKDQSQSSSSTYPNGTSFGQLYVAPETFLQRTQQEIYTYTVSNFISDLFNFSSFVTIYAILFGTGKYRPWGLFQRMIRRWRPHQFSFSSKSQAGATEENFRLSSLEAAVHVYLGDFRDLHSSILTRQPTSKPTDLTNVLPEPIFPILGPTASSATFSSGPSARPSAV